MPVPMGMVNARLRKSRRTIALLFAVSAAAAGLGVLAVLEDILVLFSLCFGLSFVIFIGGLMYLHSYRRARRLLKQFGIDDAALERIEHELYSARRFERLYLSEQWLFSDYSAYPLLFPLKEIAYFKREYVRMSLVASDFALSVAVMFHDGSEVSFPCDVRDQDEVMDLLSKRCPQANQRDWGTFL